MNIEKWDKFVHDFFYFRRLVKLSWNWKVYYASGQRLCLTMIVPFYFLYYWSKGKLAPWIKKYGEIYRTELWSLESMTAIFLYLIYLLNNVFQYCSFYIVACSKGSILHLPFRTLLSFRVTECTDFVIHPSKSNQFRARAELLKPLSTSLHLGKSYL